MNNAAQGLTAAQANAQVTILNEQLRCAFTKNFTSIAIFTLSLWAATIIFAFLHQRYPKNELLPRLERVLTIVFHGFSIAILMAIILSGAL